MGPEPSGNTSGAFSIRFSHLTTRAGFVLDLKHIRFYIGLILYFVVNGHLAICIASALFTGWSYSCDLVMFKHLCI